MKWQVNLKDHLIFYFQISFTLNFDNHFDRQNCDVKFVSSILVSHFTAFTFLHDSTWSQTRPNPFYMWLCIYIDPNDYLVNSKNAMHWLCDLTFNSIWYFNVTFIFKVCLTLVMKTTVNKVERDWKIIAFKLDYCFWWHCFYCTHEISLTS